MEKGRKKIELGQWQQEDGTWKKVKEDGTWKKVKEDGTWKKVKEQRGSVEQKISFQEGSLIRKGRR